MALRQPIQCIDRWEKAAGIESEEESWFDTQIDYFELLWSRI